MKNPRITNNNCRSPWTFGHRIRRWEVLFENEVLQYKGKEVDVLLVLVEGRDIFITVDAPTWESLVDPDEQVLARLRVAKQAVKSIPRFRWKFLRITCLVVTDERKLDVTDLL